MRPTIFSFSFGIALVALLMPLVVPSLMAQQAISVEKGAIVLKAYGPGGPAPAMREAAKVFGTRKGITVEITAGPTPAWKDQAMKDAELIFSGSEYMMTDFVRKDLPGLILKVSKALKTLPNRGLRYLWLKGPDKSACGRM